MQGFRLRERRRPYHGRPRVKTVWARIPACCNGSCRPAS